MTRIAFARELESASDAIADIALTTIASELAIPKGDLVARILREWLETNAYLPVP
ncbi:hypothetical protein [Mesorhizobium sp. B2-4-19]|uniref:hypothetical protein n=1 Tax=Mesorhizobium sp. B2-4-19 TaxID=2589930 RepID=UPI0015E3DCCE|nr:hypothetical protein [Mesorhizobium sp. B2-4-19]